MNKRKEILYYSLFIVFNVIYFFINAPDTFFNIPEDQIFEASWYENTNLAVLLLTNFFYLKFIQHVLIEFKDSRYWHLIFKVSYGTLPILFILFALFPKFNLSKAPIFYLTHIASILIGILVIIIFIKKNGNSFTKLIVLGILGNIIGMLGTLYMILRYNSGLRELSIDSFPLVFMRIGILIELFCYQLVILKKWHIQETELATKELQNQLNLANLKNEISSELHDDIGTSLSKINLQSFLLQNNYASEGSMPILKSIQSEITSTMIRLKDIIWSVDNKENSFQNLFDRIIEYTHDVTAPLNILLKQDLNLINHLELPSVKTQYHIYLMSKEIINNAVKHSNCNSISIALILERNGCVLQITDDGKGFDLTDLRTGKGVNNVQKRAEIIGSKLEINSTKMQGTTYRIYIPISDKLIIDVMEVEF